MPNKNTFDGVRGRQAGKNFYIAMCTMRSVARMFTFTDVDIPAEQRSQRTLRKSRIPKIRDYMITNPTDYVFSSVTVSVDGKIKFTPTSQNKNLGVISISQNAAILINDGQHRISAIKEAIVEKPSLADDEISVVFFEDLKLENSQQMFADLNKHAVKPTKSLGILYDRRNDFATFVVNVTKQVKIFYNKIEMEKTTISNRSTKFFTLNGLLRATKNLLGKDNLLKDYEKEIVIDFWNIVSKNIPEWQLLINNKTSPSELRKDYVHANTNMLEAIAIAGNMLIKKYPDNWKHKLAGLQNIDWRRSNPEWFGKTIVDGKMTKTIAGMKKAAKIILKYCEAIK